MRNVIDATLLSIELDLLEIRWRELSDVVDKFIIMEGTHTFTGIPKDLMFSLNRERFSFISDDRIIHHVVNMAELQKGENPFINEAKMRREMNYILANVANKGDLVIMADIDEIVSAETIRLLRSCDGFPSSLHLQLKTYIYSFEFIGPYVTWQPNIVVYDPETTVYKHSNMPYDAYQLADAGILCFYIFLVILKLLSLFNSLYMLCISKNFLDYIIAL